MKNKNDGNLEMPIIVECQKVNIEEECEYVYDTRTVKLNFDVDPEVRHLVDIKKRKCFLPIVIGDTYSSLFSKVSEALADNVIFEKIILRSTIFDKIEQAFEVLKNKNIYTFELDKAGGIAAMPSNFAIFCMGHSKVARITKLEYVDCEKDLFVFSKTVGVHLIKFKDKKDLTSLDFYAPSLEQCPEIWLRKHSNLYCPSLKKIETSGIGKPEVFYVSPNFDVSQLPGDWKMVVKYYTPEQLEKIEMAKEELLAYIAINPELSNASLNCPKPNIVPQEKWDRLIKLRNRLMALLRGENPPKVTVFQMQ
ncbi:MAG: hypothetical protein ACLRFH_01745 [Opitutales bacterium]